MGDMVLANLQLVKDLAKEIAKEMEEEKLKQEKLKQKKKKKKVLHNTKLLMKNYNCLKAHIDKVVDKDKIKWEYDDKVEEEVILISSITRTKLRTAKMLAYIDSALKIVEQNLTKNNEKYKFIAFKKLYFSKNTIEEIAFELNCGNNSVRRWNDYVIEELSLLLWGIDSLEF